MRTFALLLGILGTACAARVGTSGGIYVPRDAAQSCTAKCSSIGLGLNSVVIMANNVGCVCNAAANAPGGAGGAGGMAALMMQEHEQQNASRTTHQTNR